MVIGNIGVLFEQDGFSFSIAYVFKGSHESVVPPPLLSPDRSHWALSG